MALNNIRDFCLRNGKLDLSVLMTCHSLLARRVQDQLGYMVEYDLLAIVKSASANQLSRSGMSVYAALLLESCLLPTMTSDCTLVFDVKGGIENEEIFLKGIMEILLRKTEGRACLSIDKLERDYEAFRKYPPGYTQIAEVEPPVSSSELLARMRRFGFDVVSPVASYDKVTPHKVTCMRVLTDFVVGVMLHLRFSPSCKPAYYPP
jgi:hypothetical protein